MPRHFTIHTQTLINYNLQNYTKLYAKTHTDEVTLGFNMVITNPLHYDALFTDSAAQSNQREY